MGLGHGVTTHSGPFYSEATHPSDKFMLFLGEYLLIKNKQAGNAPRKYVFSSASLSLYVYIYIHTHI